MKNFVCLDDNPVVKHKLTIIRDKETKSKDFREIVDELTYIVAVEGLKELDYVQKKVLTPLQEYKGIKLESVVMLPIIRAGIAMINPVQKILPKSQVGFIGLSRNKDLSINEYYFNVPNINNKTVIILDPMLATGNSIVRTIEKIIVSKPKKIIVLSILCSKKAYENIHNSFPDVLIYSAGYDEELNDKGYIIPGLGDAGDRIFNT
jgi:uracil phosphoribosyltransferase